MIERLKCPECGSSLFHVEDLGKGEYKIQCYKTKVCKWEMKVKEQHGTK